MASVFRRKINRPVPPDAIIGKFKRDGTAIATWLDESGGKRECDVTRDSKGRLVRLTDTYFAKFRNHKGVVEVATTGMTDKTAAEQVVAGWLKRVEQLKSGVLSESQLITAEASQDPVSIHVDAYIASMGATITPSHKRDTKRRILFLLEEINARRIADATRIAVEKWVSKQVENGRAFTTINHHVFSLKAFMKWCVRTNRSTTDNGIGYVEVLSRKIDIRRKRRAFTPEEFQRLVSNCSTERRDLYLFAAYTGLRANEIRTLKWLHIVGLGTGNAVIELDPRTTKARRADKLPVHPDLERLLLLRLRNGNFKPGDAVVKISTSCQSRFLQSDLKRAGIAFKDDRGRQLDFHALRMTFITRLAASGVDMRTAQQLARHSTIELTAQTYTDATQLPTKTAISSLTFVCPDVCPDGPQKGLKKSKKQENRGAENFDLKISSAYTEGVSGEIPELAARPVEGFEFQQT